MNTASELEQAEVAKVHVGTAAVGDSALEKSTATEEHGLTASDLDNDRLMPSEEELHTLRRVSGPVPWQAFTVTFAELCERFSYFGTTVVCKHYDDFERLMVEAS